MSEIKLYSILLISFIGFSFNLSAQNIQESSKNLENKRYIKSIDHREDVAIDGSPYLFDNWEKGSITFKNGKTRQYDKIKFNLYTGTIDFLINGRNYHLPDMYKVESFTVGNKTFIGIFNGETTFFYEEIAFKGNIGLLKKHRCYIVKGKRYPAVGESMNDKYKKTEYLCLLKGYNNIEQIKLNEKKILKLLSDKKSEVQDFVNKNGLNYKIEEDIIKIFNYYFSL